MLQNRLPLEAQAPAPYRLQATVLSDKDSPLPFALVTDSSGNLLTVANVQGFFRLPVSKQTGTFAFCLEHPNQQKQCFEVQAAQLNESDTLVFFLNRPPLLRPLPPDNSEKLIRELMRRKHEQLPYRLPGFRYQAHNKISVTILEDTSRKELPWQVRRWLPFLHSATASRHHLFLAESVTERQYVRGQQDRETIRATRASGIRNPSYFSLTTQFQPFSIYEDYIKIATNEYLGPLTWQWQQNYDFLVTHRYPTRQQDTLYLVRFEPKPKAKFEGLAGYLFVRSSDYGIPFVMARAAGEDALPMQLYLQNRKTDGVWFPELLQSRLELEGFSTRQKQAVGTFISAVDSVQLMPRVPAIPFDEVQIDVQPEANRRTVPFWLRHSRLVYSVRDRRTYQYYDSLGRIEDFDRYLKIAEKLRSGTVPVSVIDLKLRYLLNHNDYEGLRLGLGAETNEKLFRQLSFHGYFGYGFEDRAWKWGSSATYFTDQHRQNSVTLAHVEDVRESGSVHFPFDRYQFSSEPIRRYLVYYMDKISDTRVTYETRQFRNLALSGSFSANKKEPAFDYSFRDYGFKDFRYAELGLGLKLAYREKFIQTPDRRISVGTPYPLLWLQLTQSAKNLFGSDFSYTKFDAKLEASWRVLRGGRSTVQLIGGQVLGRVPYSVLYNGKGSLKVPSVVIHNSFETMHYNEFLSDRYLALFFSHDFGRLLVKEGRFRPRFELLHNMGAGNLSHPEDHRGLPVFKTMEKGYFESGFFVNDLYVFKTMFVKTGVGAGFFFRYGPYAHDRFTQNTFFKFSTYFYL